MITWTTHHARPKLIGWGAYYTVADNRLFVAGGIADNAPADEPDKRNRVQWFDGERWGDYAGPFSRRYGGALVARGGELIMLGGRDRSGDNPNLSEIWTNSDPTNVDAWELKTSSAAWGARARFAAVVFDSAYVPETQIPNFVAEVETLTNSILNNDGAYAAVSASGGLAPYAFSIVGGSPYFAIIHDAEAKGGTVELTANVYVPVTVEITIAAQDSDANTPALRFTMALTIAGLPQNVYADGDILLLGGVAAVGSSVTWRSDMWINENGSALTEWTQSAAASGANNAADVYLPAVAAFAGKIYIMGGRRNGDSSDEIWSSDDGGQSWDKSDASGKQRWSARQGLGALVYDNALWVFGGVGGSLGDELSDVWRSVDGENWTRESLDGFSFPYHSAYGVLNGSVYVAFEDEVWSSNNMTAWTKHSTLMSSTEIGENPIFAVADDKLFVAGGEDSNGLIERMQWFDGESWNSYTLTAAARKLGAMVARGEQMIMLGGDTGSDSNDIWISDNPTDENGWTLAGSGAGVSWSARRGHAAVVNNAAYIPPAQVPHLSARIASLNTLTVQIIGVAAVVSAAGGIAPYSFLLESDHSDLLSLEHDSDENTATVILTGTVNAPTTIRATVRVNDSHVSTPEQTVDIDITIVAASP